MLTDFQNERQRRKLLGVAGGGGGVGELEAGSPKKCFGF